jgi:hypothetical protein
MRPEPDRLAGTPDPSTVNSKSRCALASRASGRRTRPSATLRRTSARLRPSPSVSSRSTRTGTGRSKLIRTLRGAGPSGGPRGVSVSSSQVPVQSRRCPFFAASDALMISSRTMAGSLAWYASRRAGSSVPEQSRQGFTTAGRPDSRTTHRALRSVFTDAAAFRIQRELWRARPRLLGSGGCTTGLVAAPGRVVRLRGRPCNKPTAGMWQRSQIHAGHRVRDGEPRATGFPPHSGTRSSG